MIEISGAYNSAKAFTGGLDEKSREQIETLLAQPFTAGSVIRFMPDVHAGAGCVVGTTMTIDDKIVPNLVGVDIGCGMETLRVPRDDPFSRDFNPHKLDKLIYRAIPSGRNVRKTPHEYASRIPLGELRCPAAKIPRAINSVGTLGGGNHFIEAARDDVEDLYITIHSGSRHLGLEIAQWYQDEAWKQRNGEGVPKELAYVTGELFHDYLNDMKITQFFAEMNRRAMMQVILEGLDAPGLDSYERFTTIHNYIDMESMILRKGAVSAKAGEKLLIPINMRDGSLICEGLGNPDWNFSAPHGAGRVMSRAKAFKTLSLDEFKNQMRGVFSTSVNKNTLDESPMAYKDMSEIVDYIEPAAKIVRIIKPVYNFKAAE